MNPVLRHREFHRASRIGWLRAAVLGANDGVLSTSSLIVGVASAPTTHAQVILSGFAGLMAGAMSMAAGEYVSVSSQADIERADLARESAEIAAQPTFEREELAQIYVERGLDVDLARQVATELMKHDALASHARDELGITETVTARPLQAALASGATFSLGASLPLVVAALSPPTGLVAIVSAASLLALIALGIIAARAGGANIWRGAWRVGFWGAFAMGSTALIGRLFGAVVQ